MKPRLFEHYNKKVVPELMKGFEYKNPMECPKLKKIVVSMCLKEATSDIKVMDRAMEELSLVTGQKPKMTRAKKAIAAFKLRAGMPLGAVVTLRGARMYEFLDRLTNVSLPRVRDFRGCSTTGFDGAGNYCLGIKEQIIFPEINFEKVDKTRGMNITFVTSANTNKEGYELLEKLGMPFRKK
ncbi:MAG: 50S ribosomal protein L5 [Deltaproteobacteria bacterium]|nr:50S ribosomal protein L5 [Deltaproteobacteria bacterium]MBM4316034.1 50S ribosomal protein L5 [Deltaproteobacteria bacterium]